MKKIVVIIGLLLVQHIAAMDEDFGFYRWPAQDCALQEAVQPAPTDQGAESSDIQSPGESCNTVDQNQVCEWWDRFSSENRWEIFDWSSSPLPDETGSLTAIDAMSVAQDQQGDDFDQFDQELIQSLASLEGSDLCSGNLSSDEQKVLSSEPANSRECQQTESQVVSAKKLATNSRLVFIDQAPDDVAKKKFESPDSVSTAKMKVLKVMSEQTTCPFCKYSFKKITQHLPHCEPVRKRDKIELEIPIMEGVKIFWRKNGMASKKFTAIYRCTFSDCGFTHKKREKIFEHRKLHVLGDRLDDKAVGHALDQNQDGWQSMSQKRAATSIASMPAEGLLVPSAKRPQIKK